MEEFVIQSEREVSLTFHSRKFGADGWLESYSITAAAKNASASLHVENPPYGLSPADFFQKLAESWAGWKGEKTWGALEGEYNLVASTDLTGHITLAVELNPSSNPPCFSGVLSLIVEAGQLEALAGKAKIFFAERV
jgi:hypothetical protein